jgi:adenylyl- and sulfurtransferase ThiI
MKRTAILRWTGRGTVSHLASSVEFQLQANKVRGRVSVVGSSITVLGPEPLEVAALMQYLPGVAWIAAGFAAESPAGLAKASASLAKAYLSRGDRFSVVAEGTGGALASDVGGAVTSRILESVKGARVSESPRVRFRAVADGREGAVGVEVKPGPGGVPTGTGSVSCLVSGGVHSAVTAWMAVLAGFRVRLIHAKVSEESLRAVAKLYSELSNRADARGLSLEVLDGGPAAGMVAEYAARSRGRMFGGFRAADGGPPESLQGRVSAPLFLLPEEKFQAEFESLGIKAFESRVRWGESSRTSFKSSRFSGGPADASQVLDGLG